MDARVIEPIAVEREDRTESRAAVEVRDRGDDRRWSPPSAPLAMPRQILERHAAWHVAAE